MKRILILGAGMVSRPIVHYLSDQKEFEITVASRTVSKAEALVDGRSNAKALALNVKDEAAVDRLLEQERDDDAPHEVRGFSLPSQVDVDAEEIASV